MTLMRLLGRIMKAAKKHGGPGGPPELVQRARDAGLAPRHIPVMVTLAMFGSAAVGELAGRIGLEPATTSQLVGELQRAGLVTKEADERDRRRTVISVAAPWRPVVEEFARTKLTAARRTMDALTPVEREHFLRGLRLLAEAQDEVLAETPPADPPPCPLDPPA
ncbi:MarR family protein [Actinomadura rubteroloni]|uniref:MarR family protein n=1 Tax=Actinomadura rubteroloni TaxID=1926885 RepID=A0A2P4UGP9_9ACTN|nr:MarR family protein [Actinomadura rubteroloni]